MTPPYSFFGRRAESVYCVDSDSEYRDEEGRPCGRSGLAPTNLPASLLIRKTGIGAECRYESTAMPSCWRSAKYWLLTLNRTSSFRRSSVLTELVLSSDALMI